MRRADRTQNHAFCLDLIDRCTHGVAAISTGEDTPYCIPLSFVRIDQNLYFHCALSGRKTELLEQNPRMCVTFVGGDQPAFEEPCSYTTYFQSVVVTGTAFKVENPVEKTDALRALCQKLTPEYMDDCRFNAAIQKSLSVTAVWRVEIEQLSGKAKFRK